VLATGYLMSALPNVGVAVGEPGMDRLTCRVASRNFVTGCLTNDVTGRSGNDAFRISSSGKYAAQSAAKGGRDSRMWRLRAMVGSRGDIGSDEAQIAYQPLCSFPAPDSYATV